MSAMAGLSSASGSAEIAKHFFAKLGFHVLHGTTMSYLESYCGERTPYYILGMVLEQGVITS